MCIIYSSYIQHLTNKHKERQTTEKSTVGSEAQRRWELFECKWVPMSAPHSGVAPLLGIQSSDAFSGKGGEGRSVGSSRDWAATRFPKHKDSDPSHVFANKDKTVKPPGIPGVLHFYDGTAPAPPPPPGFQPAVRPDVWSAQTWTLGTLFTHVVVTCKPPCRKHKIHLYILLFLTSHDCADRASPENKRKEGRESGGGGQKSGFQTGSGGQSGAFVETRSRLKNTRRSCPRPDCKRKRWHLFQDPSIVPNWWCVDAIVILLVIVIGVTIEKLNTCIQWLRLLVWKKMKNMLNLSFPSLLF